MSSISLLPNSESQSIKNRDVAYRGEIVDYSSLVDINPYTCETELLPYLAQNLQVLFWSKFLSEDDQRRLIANSRYLHRHLGTPFAIKKIFELIERKAELVEWFESDRLEPYHFLVKIFDEKKEGFSQELIESFEQLLETYKNVRSVLDEIGIVIEIDSKLVCLQQCSFGERIVLYPKREDIDISNHGDISLYSNCIDAEIVHILPRNNEINIP